jgi:acetyltransferase-like isoleucine patch superfamily enzyme
MDAFRTHVRRVFTPGRLGRCAQQPRVWKYRALSTCADVTGTPVVYQPVLLLGDGAISFGQNVEFGWRTSPAFYSGYGHIEAYLPGSHIEFCDDAQINNSAFIKSEGPGIRIGPRALLGSFVEIFDSDFHDLQPARRRGGSPNMAAVELEENVFIGNGARILKGVTVGAHSVVGAGSVVTTSIPRGVIAAGNPARVVRELRDDDARPDEHAAVWPGAAELSARSARIAG